MHHLDHESDRQFGSTLLCRLTGYSNHGGSARSVPFNRMATRHFSGNRMLACANGARAVASAVPLFSGVPHPEERGVSRRNTMRLGAFCVVWITGFVLFGVVCRPLLQLALEVLR